MNHHNNQSNLTGTKEGRKGEKGTNFTMATNELLEFFMNRKNIEMSPIHYRLVLYFIRELQGWAQEEQHLCQKDMSQAIGTSIQKLNPALNDFVAAGILNKVKVPGKRGFLYGFNKIAFGRVLATEETRFTPEVIKDNIHQIGKLRFTHQGEVKVITLVNRKSLKSLNYQRKSRSKDIRNKIKDISLVKFREFLEKQPKNTRLRWERWIAETLKSHPGDESMIHLALDWVHRDKKDFMGNEIRSSIIGLFEKTEWELAKQSLLIRVKREEQEEAKKKRLEEEQRIVQEKRRKLQEDLENPSSTETAMTEISKVVSLLKGMPG